MVLWNTLTRITPPGLWISCIKKTLLILPFQCPSPSLWLYFRFMYWISKPSILRHHRTLLYNPGCRNDRDLSWLCYLPHYNDYPGCVALQIQHPVAAIVLQSITSRLTSVDSRRTACSTWQSSKGRRSQSAANQLHWLCTFIINSSIFLEVAVPVITLLFIMDSNNTLAC